MKFFKKQNVTETTNGRVYLIKLILPNGYIVHKIGMTHSPRSVDRMMEILRSWFTLYRYVPHAELRLDKETGVPLLLEKHMHEVLKEWKYVPDKKVDGAQEMFMDLNEDIVIDYLKHFDYSLLLNCTTIKTQDYNYIQSQINPLNLDPVEDIPF